jgi:alkylation response protein AidB-like acyl-CoA dehydrogenase
MSLVYDEDERMLLEAARGFLQQHAAPAQLRQLRDTRDADGFSRQLWAGMVEMGWAGLLVPEEFGGLGFSHAGAGILCEQSGRTLSASPLFSSAIVCASLIRDAASVEQKQKLLPAIAEGRLLCALAIDEQARHDPAVIGFTARETGEGFSLSGEKILVLDGHVANTLIVVARSAGNARDTHGISLFLVEAGSPGLHVERTVMVDSRNAATLRCQELSVPRTALLGELHGGWAALERALDIARICCAAELLGVASEVFARTVEYLKQRKQFGKQIGEFQALQHRAAQLFCDIELTRSAVLRALRAIDAQDSRLAALASLAKVKACDTATLAVNEAVQMHGGMGMTDEFEIGFFMKRAAALRQVYGDSYYHINRFAGLGGY